MSLRQEYNKNKIALQEAKKAEIQNWLSENVVFLTERMDRARVKRLINLMLKFDQKFGPFKDKIPGISSIVSDAENALQMALSGRLTDSKISEIFQRLSIIYALLSDFFANDLKLLLQTPAFKVPRSKPEVRLDSITDAGYSPKHITDTIVLTLTPSEEELAFLNKLYKGVTLPQLDRHSIASQMLGLSYKDLEGLCGIEQVPMAVIPDEKLLNEAGFIKNVLGGAAAGVVTGAVTGAGAGNVLPGVGTVTGAGVGAVTGGLAGGAKALYDFFRSPQVEAVKKTINDLQTTTNKLQIPSLTAAMKDFRNRLNAAMVKKAPTKTDTLVLSQAVVVAEFYKNIAEKLKELVKDPDAKTLSDWAASVTNPQDKIIVNDELPPAASDEAKQALKTLMTYLDSTVENLNPEGNLAKLKKSIFSKFKIPNTQNTLPQEFTAAIPKIKQEIIEIILAESTTLRESYRANKKNKFVEFDSEVNKILNESLANLQAIVNSFNTAAKGVEAKAAVGASAPGTVPGAPGGGTPPGTVPGAPGGAPGAVAPAGGSQGAPAGAPGGAPAPGGGSPAAAIDRAEAKPDFSIGPADAGLAVKSFKKIQQLSAADDDYARGILKELENSIIEAGIQTINTVEIAVNTINSLAKEPNIKNTLANPNNARLADLQSLMNKIGNDLNPEKSLSEQIPQIIKLSNIVAVINDFATKLPDPVKK